MKHPIKLQRRKLKRAMPLSPETQSAIDRQLGAFRRKFGRDAGPGDPIFFDPSADTPTPLDEDVVMSAMVAAMRQSGLPPRLIYASAKTGRIVTEENYPLLSPEARAEWDAALDEYDQRQRNGEFN